MHQPLAKLSTEPSTQPLTKPSTEPVTQPSTEPSTQMSTLVPTHLSTEPSVQSSTQSPAHLANGFNDLLGKIRNIGLKSEDVFCNLRIPNQFQSGKDEISLVILTGRGVFCIDVKDWRGEVTQQKEKWHVKLGEEDASVRQFADPVQAIKAKATNLRSHLQRGAVSLDPAHFIPRVLLLSPDCLLSSQLQTRKEVVTHAHLNAFLRSFSEDFMTWAMDAFLPCWMSGHLSYRQLWDAREVLSRTGTWDQVRLLDGRQLQGDYRGCQHLAVLRQETEELEFTGPGILASLPLWETLGYTPLVAVTMYRRGVRSLFFRPTSGTASIPQCSHVVFRIEGEEADGRIPVDHIHSISLSV
ncbi:uncharacterized protein si:zfos-911d5.4 [Brienomyrus brachyistius]|uniref:uncharacterized protein si:zfos-911d5.4 n=1 Tax=Brienomyrus brachyistius TaxID=42636 RepID=UPI0020B3156C|nr:uncharacterized protein si:zfos-911d5.4 [Brienomyrus brachyistius]